MVAATRRADVGSRAGAGPHHPALQNRAFRSRRSAAAQAGEADHDKLRADGDAGQTLSGRRPVLGSLWRRAGPTAGAVEFLRYPGKGNLDPKQGTLEFFVAPAPKGAAFREVLSLAGQGGGMSLAMRCGADSSLALTVTNGALSKSITAAGLELKPNEFVHVAITWGTNIEFFVAGKHHGALDMTLPAELAGSADKFGLRFGCTGDLYGSTGIAVDEVRVSSVVRYRGSDVAVPKAAFGKDRATLLLDHLDAKFRPDGEAAETGADVCSGRSNELGGMPTIGCRVVKGRFGSAMQIVTGETLSVAEMVRRYGANASLFWFWMEDGALTTGWPPPLSKEPLVKKLRETVKEHNAAGARMAPYMGYPALGRPAR